MHPKIIESFWSDLEFDKFQGQELANVRLTFLWTITSPTTNAAGIFPCNRRVFTSDTGLDFDWLDRTMKAFPRSFSFEPVSRHALVRRYIRYQYSQGDALAADNMVSKIIKDLRLSPLSLAREIVANYPELLRAHGRNGKGLVSPSEALGKGLPSPWEDTGSGSPSEALPKPFPDPQPQGSNPLPPPLQTAAHAEGLAKPLARACQAPREGEAEAVESEIAQGSAEGGRTIPPARIEDVIMHGARIGWDEAKSRAWFEAWDQRDWIDDSGHPIRKPLSFMATCKRIEDEPGHIKKRAGQSARLDKPASSSADDDLRALLQVETDPEKKAALNEQLRRATA